MVFALKLSQRHELPSAITCVVTLVLLLSASYDNGVADLSHIDYSNEKFLLMNPKTGHTN